MISMRLRVLLGRGCVMPAESTTFFSASGVLCSDALHSLTFQAISGLQGHVTGGSRIQLTAHLRIERRRLPFARIALDETVGHKRPVQSASSNEPSLPPLGQDQDG